jgi:hypothetical protein
MDNKDKNDDKISTNQYEYQEKHPEFKTDFSDIKWNGRESIRDLSFWEIILGAGALGGIGFTVFFLFATGAIFYAIPYIVLGWLGINILILIFSKKVKK